MIYCRFENTSVDLEDCVEHFDEPDLSESEQRYRLKILRFAKELIDDYEDELEEK